ncbi:MAG TPA: glycoside hydrolase family 43 protein [Chitinophagaceae bacterium]|jgi:alpha-N-arabinofuranosidase|nr:glycoside hydrolase family 43 protein [Chitinophagaceae bacterium]
MKKILFSLLIITVNLHAIAQEKLTYTNPILSGFYPDPSICRVGDDYYLVNSSFAYFPGLPLFHSKDLVNWKQIGHAMDRREQLDHTGAGVSRGLFAPAISYHKGTFYIVCTLIDKLGNFVISAKDPRGPWSNPVALPQVNGIDPSLFFDDNGRAYVLFNSIPPDNKPLHDGHRTIRMFEFDAVNLKIIGSEKLLVNGGTDMAKKPVWIEGPHIYKKDGWYYLLCAEGGTGFNHSEVVFRSKNVDGPYVSYEKNPVLTQRHLDPSRKDPVTTTGHADLVETKDGKWWAVFLGCRPYEGDYYNTGRETFMLPVTWKDGWPIILEGDASVRYRDTVPIPSITRAVTNAFSGNVHYNDNFKAAKLNPRWIFLRTPHTKWYDLKKGLTMQLRPETITGKSNPSFIGHRQQNIVCKATTMIDFSPASENEKAGLTIFYNENRFYYVCVSRCEGEPTNCVQLYRSTGDSTKMELLASSPLPAGVKKDILLRITATNEAYFFYYGYKNFYQQIGTAQNVKYLSTKEAGGFVGCIFGLYATSLGKQSSTAVRFSWFAYDGNDEVYRGWRG